MDIECRNFASISVGDLQVFHTVDIHVRGVGQSPSLSRTAVEAQYPLASSVFHSHATDMNVHPTEADLSPRHWTAR